MTPSTAGRSAHRQGWTRTRTAEIAFVGATLAVFAVVVAPTLGQPLLESHGFRQTQTAYTARIFHEDGIDLLHPRLPVLGKPFEVPFELPLFQAAASLVMDVGLRDDVAMRSTGLACFLLTAFLLYGLVRHVAGSVSAVAALLAFVATPFAIQWSRTSMIEYLATAGAVGFAWATVAWRDSRRPALGALALVAGLVGMLVKPTTAVFWMLPALGYRPTDSSRGSGRGRHLALAGLVAVPLLAAILWIRHADAIKSASPTTAWLTSAKLREWNFGTVAQRLDPDVWGVISARVILWITGVVGAALLCVAVLAVVKSPQRLFWVGVALAGLLPPLAFTNLYFQHTYYLAAVTPAVAALIGLGAGCLWKRLPNRPRVRGTAAVAGTLLLASGAVGLDSSHWTAIYDDEPHPETTSIARELAEVTRPEEYVGVVGLDWSPVLLYYADRRGLMVADDVAGQAWEMLRGEDYRHIVVREPSESELAPLTRWRWLSAVSPHVYGVADSRSELPAAPLAATDDISTPALSRVLRRGVRIRCGEPVSIPGGELGTQLRLRSSRPGARISVTDSYAPVPARKTILVAAELASGGTLSVTCAGPRWLTVDVLSAPYR